MRSYGSQIAGLLAVAITITLAACHPPRDARPPYHEPAAATQPTGAGVSASRPTDPAVR